MWSVQEFWVPNGYGGSELRACRSGPCYLSNSDPEIIKLNVTISPCIGGLG